MTDNRFKNKYKKIKKKCLQKKAIYDLRQQFLDCYPYRINAKVSNIMLTVIVIMIILYTIASFILQYYTGVEISSTLTTCFFSFMGGEIISLAGIKMCKVRHEKFSSDEGEDEETYG